MWKAFRTPPKLLTNVQFTKTESVKQRISQCGVSFFSTDERKISKTNSKLLHNSRTTGFTSGILSKRNGVNFNQCVRHFSEIPDFVKAGTPKFEGIFQILVDSPPVTFIQNNLITLHGSLGLPWWAEIILVTFTAKTLLTLPCALYQQHIFAKTRNLRWEMEDIVPELKMEANYRVQVLGFSESQSRTLYNKALREKWSELIVRENCHPMKGFILILTQLPLWISLSCALRNICFMMPYPTPVAYKTFAEMSTEGVAWFSNLALADPYYILPITMGVCNLINIEFSHMMRDKEAASHRKIMLNIFRFVSVALVPIAAIIPSGVSLYWTTSSVYGIIQNLTIVSPRVRRFCRVEQTEQELQNPYKHMLSQLKKRLPLRIVKSPGIKTTEVPKKSFASSKKK